MSTCVRFRVPQPILVASAALALLVPAGVTKGELVVSKISDSIVDSNALLMASGEWGRAINGMGYQAEALLTFNGYQYTTWYRNDVSMSVMVARRTISGSQTGAWEIVDTGSNFERGDNTWNTHNVISLGISRNDGRLHISYDQHAEGLRYRVSAAGVATDNPSAWGPSMFGAQRTYLTTPGDVPQMTYPTFINTPSGDLQFAYRNNHSGNGDVMLSTYTNGAWSTPAVVMSRSGGSYFGSNNRNGYYNGFDYGPDGKLHVTWTWRESTGGANHDVNYAYSEDGGVTWKNNAGTVVANTAAGDGLAMNDPGLIIKALDRKQSLYNQQAQAVDTTGRVHALLIHRRQEAGFEWQEGDPQWNPLDSAYHHYFRDPATGEWSERRLPVDVLVGTRPKIGYDAHGNVFAVYTTRDAEDGNFPYSSGDLVIAGASAAQGYTDWSILHIENLASGAGFIGEPLIDQDRLLRDGILSIFIQEDAPTVPGRTGTNLHVFEFAVPEPSSAAIGLVGLGALASRWPRP